MLETFPASAGILFEPAEENARSIEQRMEAVGGVEVRRVALSDADGERQFNFHPQRPATSSLLAEPRPDQTVESRLVPVTTIDAEWDRAGRPELDCIKVDTQGEDLRVLAGAERTLAEQAPLLIVEAIFVPLYSDQAAPSAILGFAAQRGYRLVRILDVHLTRAGELAFVDLVLAHSAPDREDCAPPFTLWSGDGVDELRQELAAADESGRAKEEVISQLSAALDEANADRRAKERVILELSAALEDLRAAGG